MSNRSVTIIRARKRGTMRFLTGSTPSLEGVLLTADLARVQVGSDSCAGDSSYDDACHRGSDLADRAGIRKPPSRSSALKIVRKLPACSHGAAFSEHPERFNPASLRDDGR